MTSIERLESMRKEVADAKAMQSRLEGQRDQLMDQLKKDFNVDSIEDAVKLKDELGLKIADKEEKFEKMVNDIAGAYEWKTL